MACSKTQVKAIMLILLIVGQDCARFHSATLLARRNRYTSVAQPLEAEEQWREVNKQCYWKATKGCAGLGCTFRPLPLDASLSASCRLSDDYMLNNSTHKNKFVRLTAEVLDKKSEKFKNECAKTKFWQVKQEILCYRRAGHLLRSTQLLMRAQQSSSREDCATEQPKIDRAITNLASLFGDDGAYILELKHSMQKNIMAVAKDIEGSLKSMTRILSKLLKGSDAEKEEARQEIRNMRTTSKTRATKEDQIEVNQSVQRLMEKYAVDVSHVENGFHQIDELAQNPASFEESNKDVMKEQFENEGAIETVRNQSDESEDDLQEQYESKEPTGVNSEEYEESKKDDLEASEGDPDELIAESEKVHEDDHRDHSKKDVVKEQSEMDNKEDEVASEGELNSLLQMQSEATAGRLSSGLIVAVLVFLLLLFVMWLVPHLAAVFWGIILPTFMVLIIGVIVLLIVRALLRIFRGRSSGNGRRGGKPIGREFAGGKNGRRRSGAVDTQNRRKGPTRAKRGIADGRKGASNGRDGRTGATDGRRDSARRKNGRNGAADERKKASDGKDGRKSITEVRNGRKGATEKRGAVGRALRNRIRNLD